MYLSPESIAHMRITQVTAATNSKLFSSEGRRVAQILRRMGGNNYLNNCSVERIETLNGVVKLNIRSMGQFCILTAK